MVKKKGIWESSLEIRIVLKENVRYNLKCISYRKMLMTNTFVNKV